MWVSDAAIKRPVFAVVISLLLVAFGILSFDRLALREYPDIDTPIVSISTQYRGASAEIVETKITQLIEDRIAGIEGIRAITSSSLDGVSRINIEFDLNRNIDNAANDVRDRISRVLKSLPDEADPPEVQKSDANESVMIWIHAVSDNLDRLELTDYVDRYLVDRFSVVDGVSRVRVSGGYTYSMRIWLDRKALAARELTVADVENALRAENVDMPSGSMESEQRHFIVKINRNYKTAEDFQSLVVHRGEQGYLVRLKDVARVELGPAKSRNLFRGNGVNMVGIGIIKQSTANALAVSRGISEELERVEANLPPGITLIKSFDSSMFVESAVDEVYNTLIIAAILVVLVIFLFLGDFRAMLVPAITVPVSLVATCTALYVFGYSLNLLTLLALVLAIGLVVDDSIVVLENVHRRLVAGESPLVAAYRGTRQVGFAVVATTLVLISVFVPITFLEGNVGRLFAEFAIALAAAVFFSSIVALTLSPVICAKFLNRESMHGGLADSVSALFEKIQHVYGIVLRRSLSKPWLTVLGFFLVIGLMFAVSQKVPSEFAPKEDRGIFFGFISGPEGSSFEYTKKYVDEIERRMMPMVEDQQIHRLLLRAPNDFDGAQNYNGAVMINVLKPFDSGRRDAWTLMNEARQRLNGLTGARAFPVMPQALGGSSGRPVQFVLGGANYEELAQWRDIILKEARGNANLFGLDSDYKETKPQVRVTIDKDRAGDLGVSVLDIGRTLETLLGSRKATSFVMDGEEYDVILEGEPDEQRSPGDLQYIYIRSNSSGELIPLANLINYEESAGAGKLNRYNRVRSVTIESSIATNYTLGEALDYLENIAREKLPPGVNIDYKGESLEYKRAGDSVYFILALSLLVVFLVLAAQFESFIHPFVILLTVPLAMAGALIGLFLMGQSFNIYSQVALIMLVGLAAKNGILIVEFANQLRDQGIEFDEALIQAAEKRLRPIIMTAITTVMGVVPLLLSDGAGSEARYVIGVVVAFGVSATTVFTLMVVPVAYHLLAKNTGSPKAVSKQLEQELGL